MNSAHSSNGAWAVASKAAKLYKEGAKHLIRTMDLNSKHCSPTDWKTLCDVFGGEDNMMQALNIPFLVDPAPVINYRVWCDNRLSIATTNRQVGWEEASVEELLLGCSSTVTTNDIQELCEAIYLCSDVFLSDREEPSH